MDSAYFRMARVHICEATRIKVDIIIYYMTWLDTENILQFGGTVIFCVVQNSNPNRHLIAPSTKYVVTLVSL